MKKLIGYQLLIVALCLFCSHMLSAQNQEKEPFKKFTLGGQLNITDLNVETPQTIISPYLGYSLNRKLMIGGKFGYSTTISPWTNNFNDINSTGFIYGGEKNYQFGLFSRYTFNPHKKFSFNLQLGANLNVMDPQIFQTNTDPSPDGFFSSIESTNELYGSFDLTLGLKYSISKRFDILFDVSVLKYDFLSNEINLNLNSGFVSPKLEFKF